MWDKLFLGNYKRETVNLKLKRLVRTNTSEQYALYDLDQSDGENQPLTIGKVDLHYTGEGVYGTLLLWDESTRQLRSTQRRAFVNAILAEITQPMGVPNEFVVEFFMPMLEHYELFHNVGLDEADMDEAEADVREETEEDAENEDDSYLDDDKPTGNEHIRNGEPDNGDDGKAEYAGITDRDNGIDHNRTSTTRRKNHPLAPHHQ